MQHRIKYAIILFFAICINSSCKKEYYNCSCSYINEYGELDTMMLSVRTTNRGKADKKCADAEIEIAKKEGFSLFCRLE